MANLLPWRESLRNKYVWRILIFINFVLLVLLALLVICNMYLAKRIINIKDNNGNLGNKAAVLDNKLKEFKININLKKTLIKRIEFIKRVKTINILPKLVATIPSGIILLKLTIEMIFKSYKFWRY